MMAAIHYQRQPLIAAGYADNGAADNYTVNVYARYSEYMIEPLRRLQHHRKHR